MNMKPIPHINANETERYLGAELHSAGIKDTLSSRVDKAIKKMEMLRGIKYIHQRAKVIKTFIWPMLYYWFSFEELNKVDANRLNNATWNYVYTGHPSWKANIAMNMRALDANKFSDGGLGLFNIWDFANHQNAKQFNKAIINQEKQIWAHSWMKKPNKKAEHSKKKWKQITRSENMEALEEWKQYQQKVTPINVEIESKQPIWKNIFELKVHPTVKNFMFKRCRRQIRTVKDCNSCNEKGYTHIIHGNCPFNNGKKYSMNDFVKSLNNKSKHNQEFPLSGQKPAEVANTWYANWFTYQAENNWLGNEPTNEHPKEISKETANLIRSKTLRP